MSNFLKFHPLDTQAIASAFLYGVLEQSNLDLLNTFLPKNTIPRAPSREDKGSYNYADISSTMESVYS